MSEIFNQTSEVSSLSKMIEKDFTLQGSECLIPSVDLNSLEEFKKYLTAKLSYLLDNKYDVLINTLYRIDVDENKLNELFSGKNKVNIPEVLAELIIARQLLKVRFRQKYNEGKF
jgi:hypothetical protein